MHPFLGDVTADNGTEMARANSRSRVTFDSLASSQQLKTGERIMNFLWNFIIVSFAVSTAIDSSYTCPGVKTCQVQYYYSGKTCTLTEIDQDGKCLCQNSCDVQKLPEGYCNRVTCQSVSGSVPKWIVPTVLTPILVIIAAIMLYKRALIYRLLCTRRSTDGDEDERTALLERFRRYNHSM